MRAGERTRYLGLSATLLVGIALPAGFACAPAAGGRRDVPQPKEARSSADAGQVPGKVNAGPHAALSRRPRFGEPRSSLRWVFPDAERRSEAARRLATKLSAQLDAEHGRGATGPGFAFALVIDGEVMLLEAKGLADLESKRPATPDTVYRVASLTKTFTATAVMALRDEGQLSTSDALVQHMPELDVVYPHRDDAPIRIDQVLTHSAGFARSGAYAELPRASTEADLVEAMKQPLTADPGLDHRYSNLAFGILGLMVGRKAAMPYRDFVRTRLLEPLRMTSSSFDIASLPPDRVATAYKRDGAPRPRTANGAGEGAGGLWSTARDLAEWIRFQLAAWPPRDDPDDGPIRRATLREMHTPRLPFAIATSGGATRTAALSVGFAWEMTRGCYFDRLVGHDGDLESFHARLRFDVDRDVGFAILGNSDSGDLSAVTERLLDMIAAENVLARRKREPATTLIERAEHVMKRLGPSWTDADHADAFGDALRAELPLREAIALGTRIANEVGSCRYARSENVTDALDAELVFDCTRGSVRAVVSGTGSPLRFAAFKLEAVKSAGDDDLAIARQLALRMQTRDDDALAKVLHTKALDTKTSIATQANLLLKAGRDAGSCKVEGGEVVPQTRSASFHLACAKSTVTLRIQRRDSSVDLTGVDVAPKCLR